MWPETVAALREARDARAKPKQREYWHLAFLTRKGEPWGRTTHEDADDGQVKLKHRDYIGRDFQSLLHKLGLDRDRLGFYTLRHVFETIAGDSRDQVAVDAIMGHCLRRYGLGVSRADRRRPARGRDRARQEMAVRRTGNQVSSTVAGWPATIATGLVQCAEGALPGQPLGGANRGHRAGPIGLPPTITY